MYLLRRGVMTLRGSVLLVVALLLASRALHGQVPGVTVTGHITAQQNATVGDALVILDPRGVARRTRSGPDGAFRFIDVPVGLHELQTFRIGFRPDLRAFAVSDTSARLTIALERISVLDTVAVTARRTGVYGTVLANGSFAPIADVSIRLIGGAKLLTSTDSLGQFAIAGAKPGNYMAEVTGTGYVTRTLSFAIPVDSSLELGIILDEGVARDAKRLAGPMQDMEERTRARGQNSALVPGQELAPHAREGLGDALRYARSYLLKGLVLDDGIACVWVNGQPAPGVTANAIDAGDVEAVEVYGLRADLTRTLQWPRGVPCGTGLPPTHTCGGGSSGRAVGLQRGSSSARTKRDDCVRSLVVWTKRQE
jgi:hypothetical protein